MRKPRQESRPEDISYRDVITIALLGFVMLTVLLLPFLNPPAIEDTPATDTGIQFEISWPDEMDVDVDLWVQAPGERAVGYSHLGSPILNLQRDDLGAYNDFGFSNHETIRSTGFVPGPYIVNLHLFGVRAYPKDGIVPVAVRISHESKGKRSITLFQIKVQLNYAGQEITVIRFKLNDKGFVIPGSMNNIPTKIRSR